MEIIMLRDFFMWSTIINVVLMLISFLFCSCAGDCIYRVHSRWFPMPKETFTVVLYSLFGVYKVLVLMFNFVPYLALLIVA